MQLKQEEDYADAVEPLPFEGFFDKEEKKEGWKVEEDEEENDDDDEEEEEDAFCSDSIQFGSFEDGTEVSSESMEESEEMEEGEFKYRGMEFYCEACDVRVTSIVALQDHFAGAKHQKRLKQVGLDVDLTDLVKGPSNPELKRKLLRCKLCDVIVRGSEMSVHTRCAAHQEKMQFFDSEDQDEDESIWFNEVAINPDSFLKSLDDGFHCDLCGVTLPSNDLFRKHLDGKRHQKRLRWEFLEQTEDDHGDSNQMQYWCKICNIFCTSKEALDKHFLGKKHAKMLKSKGVVSKENGGEDGVDSASAEQDDHGDSNQVQFWCKLCNIFCTCKDALDKHYVGKKHAKVLKSKRVVDENGGEDGMDSASAEQDVRHGGDSASSKKKKFDSDYYSSSEHGSGHNSYSRHSSSSDHGHSSSGYRRYSASEYGSSSSDYGSSADHAYSAHSSSEYSSRGSSGYSSHDYSAPSSSDYESSSRYGALEHGSTSGHRSASQYGSTSRIVKLEYDDGNQSTSPSHQSNDHKYDQPVYRGKQTSIHQHEQPFSIHQYEQPLSLRRYEQSSYNVYERPPSFDPERPTSSTSLKPSCHPNASSSTRSFAIAPLLKSICEENEPDSTSSEDVDVKVFNQIASNPQEVKCIICNKMLQSNAEISQHLDSQEHLTALYQSTNSTKQLQNVVVPVRKL